MVHDFLKLVVNLRTSVQMLYLINLIVPNFVFHLVQNGLKSRKNLNKIIISVNIKSAAIKITSITSLILFRLEIL